MEQTSPHAGGRVQGDNDVEKLIAEALQIDALFRQDIITTLIGYFASMLPLTEKRMADNPIVFMQAAIRVLNESF